MECLNGWQATHGGVDEGEDGRTGNVLESLQVANAVSLKKKKFSEDANLEFFFKKKLRQTSRSEPVERRVEEPESQE